MPETWTYGYDNANHMTWAEDRLTDGGVLLMRADYKYDVFGNRIEKDVDADGAGIGGTTVTRFGMDGWNPAKGYAIGLENFDVWADLNGSSSLTTRYVRGDRVDEVFARIDGGTGGTPYWYLTDHLGSIRDVLDSGGAVKDHLSYDGFGNITSETDATKRGRYAWTGREIDTETGLQYNRARYYDGAIGRWTSQDPLGFEAGDSNLYRYARNGPVNGTDPTGYDSVEVRQDGAIIWIKGTPGKDAPLSPIRSVTIGSHAGRYPYIGPPGVRLKWGVRVESLVKTIIPMAEDWERYLGEESYKTFWHDLTDQERTDVIVSYFNDPKSYKPNVAIREHAKNLLPNLFGNRKKFVETALNNDVPRFYIYQFLRALDKTSYVDTRPFNSMSSLGIVGAILGTPFGFTGTGIGFVGGVSIGAARANWTGEHKICHDFIAAFEKNLAREFGENLITGANGGIKSMGFAWWDTKGEVVLGGQDHTTWKVVFKDGTNAYIDIGALGDKSRFSFDNDILPRGWTPLKLTK